MTGTNTDAQSAVLASSAGTAQDLSIPLNPSGQTLYTTNLIVARVNGQKMMITSAQLQQYLDNGYDVRVCEIPDLGGQ